MIQLTNPNSRQIQLVQQGDTPTPEQIERCKAYTNLGVGNQSPNDWYCLLPDAQGSLEATLLVGIMLDAGDFIRDSLFCEWGYIVNLDAGVFEVWRGFQKTPTRGNRYGTKSYNLRGLITACYYPCKLVWSCPLQDVDPEVISGLEQGLES